MPNFEDFNKDTMDNNTQDTMPAMPQTNQPPMQGMNPPSAPGTMPPAMQGMNPPTMPGAMPPAAMGAMPPAMPGMMPPAMNQTPSSQDVANVIRALQTTYPEIFYKIQPYIMMACDQLDAYTPAMPDQKMIEQIADDVYEQLMRMHPELADYMRGNEKPSEGNEAVQAMSYGYGGYWDGGYDRDGFCRGGYCRRRGLPRDLIQILLLSELGRRRRRFFY